MELRETLSDDLSSWNVQWGHFVTGWYCRDAIIVLSKTSCEWKHSTASLSGAVLSPRQDESRYDS